MKIYLFKSYMERGKERRERGRDTKSEKEKRCGDRERKSSFPDGFKLKLTQK